MDSKLRLGEVYLFKDEWKISLSCQECGLETDSLEHFLLHCLEHKVPVSGGDIYGLLEKLNERFGQQVKEEAEEELDCQENDPLEYVQIEAEPKPEAEYQSETTEGVALQEDVAPEAEEALGKEEASKKPIPDPAKLKRIRSKLADGRYQCEYCDKVYEKTSTYYMHVRTHTNPLRCEICGLVSDSSYQHTVHRNRHLGIKPYECSECGKKFTSKAEVKIHMRTHTGERPYSCPDCGRSYTNSSHLAVHRRRHTNERLYVCIHCGKSFFTLAQMREHEDSHSDARNQVCNVCHKTFIRRAALQQHLKLHADKNYTCSVCGKKFAQNAGLYSHMKSHNKSAARMPPPADVH